MAFTDITYYVGSLLIPFANKDTSSFDKVYLERYERELLITVLGTKLYNEFTEGLKEDPIPQKWLDLRDGKTYDFDNDGISMQVHWNGLKNDIKVSPLAYYVYPKYMEQNYRQSTGIGEMSASKENGRDVPMRHKVVSAYLECQKYTGRYPYASDYYQKLLYPSDIEEDCLHKTDPSLLNFLFYHKDEYPSWVLSFPDIYAQNMFDL